MKFNPRVVDVPTYPMAALAAKKAELKKIGKEIFDFGTGDPIEPTPAFIRNAASQAIPAISQYPTIKGLEALRKAAGEYLKRRFSVTLNPDTQILAATGSKEAIYNLAFLMIDPDSERRNVIYPVPGYPVMDRSARIAGANLIPFHLTASSDYLLDLGTLSDEVLRKTAIAWINYPHNPTGATCSLDYLKRQVEIAERFGILLCSDECYVDIYFTAEKPPSVLEVTDQGVLAFHSCSKRSGMTGYRSGFVAGDQEVLAAYAGFRATVGAAAPVYTEAAATAAWSDDRHVLERNAIFQAKRDLFLTFFTQAGIQHEPCNATFYLWATAPHGMDGQEYADKLLDAGIIVSPGAFFGEHCRNYFRLALVPSVDDCSKAITKWQEIL